MYASSRAAPEPSSCREPSRGDRVGAQAWSTTEVTVESFRGAPSNAIRARYRPGVEPEEYGRIAAVEDQHWWYRNTRALMAELLGPWLAAGQTILDAGCGPGGNGAWLTRHGRVVGVDVSAEALRFVRSGRPELAPVRADLQALPFREQTFDVVVAITVVCSVPDDAAAMTELARVLRPGGVALVLEPAFRALRRAHDKTGHVRRRYRRAELVGAAVRAGLLIERATYAYSFLAPPAAVLAAADRLRPRAVADAGSDVDRRALDPLFAPLARLERWWLRHAGVPFGTSTFVVATRPGSAGRGPAQDDQPHPQADQVHQRAADAAEPEEL